MSPERVNKYCQAILLNTLWSHQSVTMKRQSRQQTHTEAEGPTGHRLQQEWGECEREWRGGRSKVPHIVGTQRNSPSAASAEFGLAVGAEVAAAIGKLGLAADATGGRVVPLLGLLTACLSPDATHLLLVALKLLVQCSEREEERKKSEISRASFTHKLLS